MSSADSLIGLGLPAEIAKRAGFDVFAVATSSAVQNGGTGVLRGAGNKIAQTTFTSASDSVTLPSDAAFGDIVVVGNVAANAGVVFPPTGGQINAAATNASVAVAANVARMFMKVNATRWFSWLSA